MKKSNYRGVDITVEQHEGKEKPFRVFYKWYNMGWHRKQIGKYNAFDACLWHIRQAYKDVDKIYTERGMA